MKFGDGRLPQRFWEKVQRPDDEAGCWLWRAGLQSEGYAQFYWRRKKDYGHRVAYMVLEGEIPSGLELDHLCRVRQCVNPEHLEPVTPRVNSLRGVSPPAMNARKVCCKNGHPLDEGNVYQSKSMKVKGERRCKTCWREQLKRRYRELRAAGYSADDARRLRRSPPGCL
jgi:hypothetical protein